MPSRFKRFPFLSFLILGALITRLVMNGLSGVGVAALVIAMVWFAFDFVRWLLPPRPQERAPGEDDEIAEIPGENLTSLVFFLAEPREVDETGIRNCVASALGIKFPVGNPDSDTFVIPFSPPEGKRRADGHIRHFMIRIPSGVFAVLVSDKPYIENPGGFARSSIRDKRLRTAVEQHLAWISVDLMDDSTDPRRVRDAYRVIGKILASMGGPDCLAIYCPELQRCNEFDPGLLESLSGDDPISLFDEPTFEPVIEISDNNPKMAAAVREAVRRWPEFVAAYENRAESDKDRFIAKAEFREGKKSEFMWVTVLKVTPGEVSGVLMNDPHELLDYHRGAPVNFSLDRLNDWIYPGKDGSHIGGFTLDVLADSGEE